MSGGLCWLQVLDLLLESLGEIAQCLYLSGYALAFLSDFFDNLSMTLFRHLDVFDFGLEGADLKFLGFNLLLIYLELFGILAHFSLDLVKLLHVLIDLIRKVLDFIADGRVLHFLSLCLLESLLDRSLDCVFELAFDLSYGLAMNLHLPAICFFLLLVAINCHLDLPSQLGIFVNLRRSFRFLLIKFFLDFLHLITERGC